MRWKLLTNKTKLMKQKTYVNNSDLMELISDIADDLTREHFQDPFGLNEEVYKHNEDDDSVSYTDQAQDYFNVKYDYLETLFQEKLGVYSDIYKKESV